MFYFRCQQVRLRGRVADICPKADFHPLTSRGWKIKGRAFIDRVGGSYK